MTGILDVHRSPRLRRGQRVYLHCRAGIGRTGMVVGCLLAERRCRRREALEELNRLWQRARARGQLALGPGDRRADCLVRNWRRAAPPSGPAAGAGHAGRRARPAGALPRGAPGAGHGGCRRAPPPSTAGRGASRRSGDMLGGGPSTCRAAPGAMTPRWRCAWPRACSSARGSMPATRWSATGAGSRRATCPRPDSASASPRRPPARWRSRSGAASRSPARTIRRRWTRRSLSRVTPVVMYFFADAGAAMRAGSRGGAHHLPGAAVLECLPGAGGRPARRPGRRRAT